MTIGFGDFVPGNGYIYQNQTLDTEAQIDVNEASAKLVVGVVYILFGMAVLAMILTLIQEQIVVQVRNALRRIRLLRPARLDDLE